MYIKNEILKYKRILLKLNKKVYDQFALSVSIYVAQTWTSDVDIRHRTNLIDVKDPAA